MDRRANHRRSHQAATAAALALILSGCTLFGKDKPAPKPEPVASLCGSIPYPPVLTRPEAEQTPPRLRRWTSGVKGALENNNCPVE